MTAPNHREMIAVAKPELGAKHQCQNCGAKFFDLNKDPIVCPKCGTVFQVAAAARARPAAKAEEEEEDDDDVTNLIDGDIAPDEET